MRRAVLLALLTVAAFAHPMGNLSVNHYSKLEPSAKGVDVTYVLDLAEIPTFELLQTWGVKQDAPKDVLEAKASQQAAAWAANLAFTEAGKPLQPKLLSSSLNVIDGAGNLPVFRITTHLHVPAKGGQFAFDDGNYPSRAGWREIVVAPKGSGVSIRDSTSSDRDISRGLTAYPQDPTSAPPQDKQASFLWAITGAPVSTSTISNSKAPRSAETTPTATALVPQPAVRAVNPPPVAATDVRPPEQPSAGTVQRGDRMSQILQMLRSKDVSWSVLALLLALAFWFGALHALEPGHGKTMAAAYLVGSRGTPRHALILGASVTFTHTISVFLLGLGTMFLSQYIMPDKITKWLGVLSGLSIVWIGGMLLLKRSRALTAAPVAQEQGSSHPHSIRRSDYEDEHAYALAHGLPADFKLGQVHSHGGITHSHGSGQTHTHVPEGEINMSSLIALGASGGLAPCPSALILLLSAISIGRPGLGIILLIAFSLGLAIVLTGTGLVVLYARNLLPESKRSDNAVFRYMPVVSAAAIMFVGILMTGVSMGWFPTVRFFG